MNKIKYAIFDFDKTIAKGDSLSYFCLHTYKKKYISLFSLLLSTLYGLGWFLNLVSAKKSKEKALIGINNLSNDDVENIIDGFYNEVILNNIYKDAIKEILDLKKKGYKILIVSASPAFYLTKTKELLQYDDLIGTEVYYKDNKYKNVIIGNNCHGQEKIKRIRDYFEKHNIIYDKDNIISFSDSSSDIPLLDFAGKANVINPNKKFLKYIRNNKLNYYVKYWQ